MKHVALVIGILFVLFFAVSSCEKVEQPTESKIEESAVGVEEPKGAMEAVEEKAEEAVEVIEEKAGEAIEPMKEQAEEAVEGAAEEAEEGALGTAVEKAKE